MTTRSLATLRRAALALGAGAGCLVVAAAALPVRAAQVGGFLDHVRHHGILGSTVPANGDQNPYAVVVSPVSAGRLREGDLLVDNFNNRGNLQGLGTTIVSIDPATGRQTLFASLPRHLAQCPGGVGLTAAMVVLRSGWVIVGSMPSEDGTTATRGAGCLLVLDREGALAGVIADGNIDGPWGMAAIDGGDHATLFVSNTGFGVAAPGQGVVPRADVLRISLDIPAGKAPAVTGETVVADGFGEQADRAAFVVGPTGLAVTADGTLYVSDTLANRVVAIDDAATRTASAGTGREVTRDGLLGRPLAMAAAPNGSLLAANGLNGQVVEIDPASGRQLGARWVDTDRAQQPPGSGDLFGIAMMPDGRGFYYVQDDTNTLMRAQ